MHGAIVWAWDSCNCFYYRSFALALTSFLIFYFLFCSNFNIAVVFARWIAQVRARARAQVAIVDFYIRRFLQCTSSESSTEDLRCFYHTLAHSPATFPPKAERVQSYFPSHLFPTNFSGWLYQPNFSTSNQSIRMSFWWNWFGLVMSLYIFQWEQTHNTKGRSPVPSRMALRALVANAMQQYWQ